MLVELNLVLVRTIYPTNLGATARVMGNMGFHRLILVDPQCEVNSKARQGAAGAQDFLERRLTYSSWEEFYSQEGRGIRIGLTRRDGKLRSALPLPEVLSRIPVDPPETVPLPVYLILGPEDDGLSAEDLKFVNYRASLPTFGEFPSINLSHAAILASYIAQEWAHSIEADGASEDSQPVESGGVDDNEKGRKLFFPDQSIRDWLVAMGFDLEKRRSSAYITLKRILLHNLPTDNELKVLEAILQQNIRKLREK
ncbi:MAG: TrmH family RNA methyltransferase [Bdellovibrionaceae bacterium]|nr:TrmH family RNA methyltransferase [Bdellovibrionales bacterium]MCB9086318.1 TrmH family RNA methyltransferase [Pseudobdellovibrionaceae bacterium]